MNVGRSDGNKMYGMIPLLLLLDILWQMENLEIKSATISQLSCILLSSAAFLLIGWQSFSKYLLKSASLIIPLTSNEVESTPFLKCMSIVNNPCNIFTIRFF